MQELFELFDAMLARKGEVDDPRELYLELAERIVKHVSGHFGAKHDEVAILMLTSDEGHLRFVAPRQLAVLGSIPISKRDSIAVGVFLKKAAEATNNVPLVKHVAFFESVKLRETPAPIQKMITVPIRDGSRIVGVAQISRKGHSPQDAGLDFNAADAKKAEDLFALVGGYLLRARPDGF